MGEARWVGGRGKWVAFAKRGTLPQNTIHARMVTDARVRADRVSHLARSHLNDTNAC